MATRTSFFRRSGASPPTAIHENEDDGERDAEGEGQPKPGCFRKMELMIEFMNLRNPRHCPNGVYVMPVAEKFNTWYGVIFVHKGYYKGGVFKFRLIIPDTYPEKPPLVYFLNRGDDIFHPLIDPTSGQFSLTQKFKDWAPHKYYIFHVLHYIKKAFKKSVLDNLVEKYCSNRKAYLIYKEKIYNFEKLAAQCARLSISETKLYNHEVSDSNPIIFTKMDDQQYEEIKNNYLTPSSSSSQTLSPSRYKMFLD